MLTMRVGAAFGALAIGLLTIAGDGAAPGKKVAEEQLVVPPKRIDDPRATATGASPWTLESAVAAYERFPDDAYLRYVVIQLAKDARPQQKALAVERLRFILRGSGYRHVDALNLTSGSRAIQESLQLEALLPAVGIDVKEFDNAPGLLEEKKDGDAKEDKDAKPQKETAVRLNDLDGPETKSRPWKKMLADKKPAVSSLSRSVPVNGWFVEVRSPGKAFEMLDQASDWMGYVSTQVFADAADARLMPRLMQQLLLDVDPKKARDLDRAVGAIALAGGDADFDSAGDLTILAEVKDAALFERLVDPAIRSRFPIVRGKHGSVDFRGLQAPDRSICVYVAEPKPGLHVRSNSLSGLKRVLDALAGKVQTLGDSDEFRYLRTRMPLGASEEDAIAYRSNPFLRRMVDARIRLVERRRAIGLSHLRLIGHAAELYATQFGKRPSSLRDIEKAGLAPVFNVGPFASPFGGAYSLSPDGLVGVCSILGTAEFLTPLAELPHSDASPLEAKLYRDFVSENAESWKSRFDPTVIRIGVTREKLRIDTFILPPEGDATYAAMAEYLSGPPVRLDALPVPNKNLFTLSLQFNKTKILQELKKLDRDRADAGGLNGLFGRLGIESRTEHFVSTDVPKAEPELTDRLGKSESDRLLERLQRRSVDLFARGLDGQVGLHFYDQRIMFDLDFPRFAGDLTRLPEQRGGVVAPNAVAGMWMMGGLPMGFLMGNFVTPLYLSAGVSDPKVVDEFFEEYDGLVRKYGHLLQQRQSGIVMAADPHVVVTKAGHRVRAFSIRSGPLRWRAYLARIGNGIFLTNQTEVIDDLHRAENDRRPGRDLGPEGHAMIRLRPVNWSRALPGFQYMWAENLRESTRSDLHHLENVSRAHAGSLTGSADEKAAKLLDLAERIDGVRYRCPQGGTYALEPDGVMWRSSLCGTLAAPEQREAPAEKSGIATLMRQFQDLTATVTFQPEGVRAVVTIERKRD